MIEKIFASKKVLDTMMSDTPFGAQVHSRLLFWNRDNAASPVANQIRYACDHFLRFKCFGNDEELQKCYGHLKRAEFDAIEMIGVVVDSELAKISHELKGNMHVLSDHIPTWKEFQKVSLERFRYILDYTQVDYGNRAAMEEKNISYLKEALCVLSGYYNNKEVIAKQILKKNIIFGTKLLLCFAVIVFVIVIFCYKVIQ